MKVVLGVAVLLLAHTVARAEPAVVDSLVVPPYLDTIVFDVFRPSADTTVDVFPPGSATPIRAGIDGVEAVTMSDIMATLVVARPRPGQWRIQKSRAGAQVRVRSQQFFSRGVLLEPDPAKVLPAREDVRLAYRVIDGTGNPIRELPGHPLSLEMTLVAPDGTKTVMAMERNAGLGPVAFVSTEDAHCTMAGRYWTDVRVTTVDAAARPLDVFRDRWSGFTVAPRPATQANALAPPRAVPRRTSPVWSIAAIAAGLLAIGALLRRLKN